MKCNSCGSEVKAGSKFCTGCGAKMEPVCPQCGTTASPAARFCMSCGASLQESIQTKAGVSSVREVSSIPLAPLALDLPGCRVAIKEVNVEGPDETDNLGVTVKYEVRNDTNEDWDYLVVHTQILDPGGCVVEESRGTEAQMIGAGDSAEFEVVFWGVNAKLLGTVPEKAHAVVSVIAYRNSQESLGEIAIPTEAYTKIALKPTKVGDILSVVSGSLWKTEPDDDMDVRVEVKLLVQNLTNKHLPQVVLVTGVLDKTGEYLTDASGSDEVRPGHICVIGGSGYGKDKEMKDAKASLSISAFWPLASGVGQQQGMTITGTENSEGNSEEDASNYPKIKSFVPEETGTDDEYQETVRSSSLVFGYLAHIRDDWTVGKHGGEISFYVDRDPPVTTDRSGNLRVRLQFVVGITPDELVWNIVLEDQDSNELDFQSQSFHRNEDHEYISRGADAMFQALSSYIDFKRYEHGENPFYEALLPYLFEDDALEDDFETDVLGFMRGQNWETCLGDTDQFNYEGVDSSFVKGVAGGLLYEIYPDVEMSFEVVNDRIVFDMDTHIDNRESGRHLFALCQKI